MRKLSEVIHAMIAEIPEQESDLTQSLKKVEESAIYAAPENMVHWQRVREILMKNFGEKPTLDWQCSVVAIWTDKPKEQFINYLLCK